MSFTRQTFVSGQDAAGNFKSMHLAGHWKPEKALAHARRHQFVGEVHITHSVYDNSGHGRGGNDGEWNADANDKLTQKVKFVEGHTRVLADGSTDKDGYDPSDPNE